MRVSILSFLILFCGLVQAAERAVPLPRVKPPPQAPIQEADGETRIKEVPNRGLKHPPLYVTVRGGYMLSAADEDVDSRWEHDTFGSYAFSLGLHAAFPRAWREIYFFAGGDFAYITSEEEIANAELSTKIAQLFATAGVTYFPRFLGDFGFTFFTSFEVWGQKETEIKTVGFSKSLGTDKTGDNNSLLPVTFVTGLQALYRVTPEFQPFLSLESRSGTALTVGMNYGF